MRELFEKIESEVRGSWRFRWLAVVAAWLVCLCGWAVVYAYPDSYWSEATVLFETTSDLRELLESMTVESDFIGQVETVQTALLGRDQLERVARETELYQRATSDYEMNGLIAELRDNIWITSDEQRGANVYVIAYSDPEPDVAFEVVGTLLNILVDESLGANREDTQLAKEFLRSQIADLERQLTESETRLAAFKRENVGLMPGEGGDYFSRLNTEMAELEGARTAIRQAERRRDTLQLQLEGDEATLASTSGEPSELDLRIAENQRQLEALELRFTDKHPDVISIRETLAHLQEQKRQRIEALRKRGLGAAVTENPVVQNIQIELARVNVELASLEEQAQTHQRKIWELRELVDVLPQIEAELAKLTRDYDVNQAQYNALLQRLEVAELSESAKQSGDTKVQVINPPVLPTSPSAPSRPLMLAVVLCFGLGAGGGLAFVANQMKPVFTSPKSLRQLTGLPILGPVQVMANEDVKRRRRAQFGSFAVAMIALCGVFILAALFSDTGSQFARSLIENA